MIWGINNSNHGSRYKRMRKVEFVRDKHYGMPFLPDSRQDRLPPTKDHNRQKRRGQIHRLNTKLNLHIIKLLFLQSCAFACFIPMSVRLVYIILLYRSTVIKWLLGIILFNFFLFYY